ncbi:MAG: hypothetical protein ABFS09_04790 [Thermodesulfobacteriota bacterium]
MTIVNKLWDDIGSLAEEEALHVITKLYASYEARLSREPENKECLQFFQELDNAISQTLECNLNRR